MKPPKLRHDYPVIVSPSTVKVEDVLTMVRSAVCLGPQQTCYRPILHSVSGDP